MKYSVDNLQELFNAMSIHIPENVIEEVETAITKLRFGNISFKGIEDAYDFFLDNIHDKQIVKAFVVAGILKIDPITPLFHAMLSDEIEIAKYLLSKGANLEGAVTLLRNELSANDIKEIIGQLQRRG